jgi:hypothetical protein
MARNKAKDSNDARDANDVAHRHTVPPVSKQPPSGHVETPSGHVETQRPSREIGQFSAEGRPALQKE